MVTIFTSTSLREQTTTRVVAEQIFSALDSLGIPHKDTWDAPKRRVPFLLCSTANLAGGRRSRVLYGIIYWTTSQWPPLSGPIRRIIFMSCN